MFFCLNCKKSADSPNCPTCGKVFAPTDEMLRCPSCNKSFFNPGKSFVCNKCGTMVEVATPQQTTQANQGFAPPMPQNNAQQSSFVPPNPFASQQPASTQQQMQNEFSQFASQPQQQNQFANPQPNAEVQSNSFQTQNIQPQSQPQADAFNSFASAQPQTQAEQPTQNAGPVDFTALFGDIKLRDNQNASADFALAREQDGEIQSASTQNVAEDGKVYDENGYEVVEIGDAKGKKNKKNKKGTDSSKPAQDYFKGSSSSDVSSSGSGKGIKVFAFTELFLLIIALVALAYFALGQYITIFDDPCQKAWKDVQSAQSLMIGEDALEGEITFVCQSEDNKFAIYTVIGEEEYYVFEIEKGFSVSTFFSMSKATFEPKTFEDVATAKASCPEVEKWKEELVF